MSALCQKRTFRHSLDYLISAGKERGRYGKTKRLCGCQVDYQLKLGRLLDRKVGWLRPTQNLVDVLGGAPEQVCDICPIGHQAPTFNVVTNAVYRRQFRAQC